MIAFRDLCDTRLLNRLDIGPCHNGEACSGDSADMQPVKFHHAYHHFAVVGGSEAACPGAEVTGHKLVANLRRPRPDILKAVVTHLWKLPFGSPQLRNIS